MHNRHGYKGRFRYFFFILILILIFPAALLFSDDNDTAGDQKIRAMKERMLKEQEEKEKKEKAEQEKKEKKDKKQTDDSEEDESDDNNIGAQIIFGLLKIMLQLSLSTRFADYPYANPEIYGLCTFDFQHAFGSDNNGSDAEEADQSGDAEDDQQAGDQPLAEKFIYVNLSTCGTYLQDDIFGSTSRCEINLLPVHLNFLYQHVFSTHEQFSMYAINGGLACYLPFLTLNGYLGFFHLDFLDSPLLGAGASAQIFFPGNLILDFYNVNAFLNPLEFYYFSCSLNCMLNRFNLGVGAEWSSYAGILYWGPYIRLGMWF